ncbi:NAD(P)-dependent oxidoreductase [Megasphaera elsdenii]|uniref:NAD(P)-dependent oxidoreductase n=2 Tax=Megasphaera elsdenii TaxID=907 RepID=A0A848EQW8_MEGEL|nr:NAD(P)-dependent oxidoreductase [Megasphaera elsdenii]
MKVAVLGLGLMGSAVAEGMVNCGHEVIVYNRTASRTEPLVEKGATAASTAAEAIKSADASIFVLTDGKAVADLLTEEVLAATEGKKILNASTTSIDEILSFAEMVKAHGGSLSEVSIMVGPDEVRGQQAYFLLGCPEEEESFWDEVLAKDGMVQRVGEVSASTKAEAPLVMASVFSSVMMSYAGAVIVKLDVPTDIAMQTVGQMVPGAENMLQNVLQRNYDMCMASTDSLIGVADAAISTANQCGMPAKIFEDMKELFVKATEKGYGSKDATSIAEIMLGNE